MLNKLVNKTILLSFLASSMLANSVYGAKMISKCDMDQNMTKINGTNINIKYPIASVSKVFTSLLATTTFDLATTFSTQVFATPVGNGLHDVHIQGSQDPYFNRYKMHMIISRLNEAGVKTIRNLTFDENVKYLHDTDSYAGFRVGRTVIRPTILKAELTFPTKELVEAQLKEQRVIMSNYPQSYLAAKSAGIELFKAPRFVVQKTAFKASTEFKAPANSVKLYVSSQDVRTMIKAMNWNSNNFSANRLLVASGGLEKLNNFYYNTLKVSESEFSFVNGSGQNHDLEGNGRLYNEASCSVVIRTLRALNSAAQKQNKQITDLMAVMGIDKGSTVGGVAYTKPDTRGKAVAKTGTVGTNITLGGVINGTNGPHYFFYNVAIASSSRREENRARALINLELAKLVRTVRAIPYNYQFDNPLKDNMDNYDEDSAPEEVNDQQAGAEEKQEQRLAQPAAAPAAKPVAPVAKPAATPAKPAATPPEQAAGAPKRVASK